MRLAAERRAAADKLQEMQGAIRVLVRCRPLSRAELAAGGGSAVAVHSTPTPTPSPAPTPTPHLICRFMVSTKRAMKYMSRIGQKTWLGVGVALGVGVGVGVRVGSPPPSALPQPQPHPQPEPQPEPHPNPSAPVC